MRSRFEHFHFILIFFCLCQSIYGKSKAIIHIGPSKTGTTHLQHFLFHSPDVLKAGKFYYPGKCEYSYRQLLPLLMDDMNMTYDGGLVTDLIPENCLFKTGEIEEFFKKHKEKENNVVISSEWLTSLNETGLHRLYNLTVGLGYETKIVMTYRFWISIFLSGVNQMSSLLTWPMKSFLADHLNVVLTKSWWRGDMFVMQKKYGSIFGIDNIIVMDYYGIIESGKDQFDVFVTEVLGIPEKHLKGVKAKQKQHNLSRDIHRYQMLQLFIEYSFMHFCVIKPEFYQTVLSHTWNNPLPLREISLLNFIEHSLEVDKEVRSNLTLIYGNRDANKEIGRNVKYSEVDRDLVASSSVWRFEFEKTLRHFDNKKMMDCTAIMEDW